MKINDNSSIFNSPSLELLKRYTSRRQESSNVSSISFINNSSTSHILKGEKKLFPKNSSTTRNKQTNKSLYQNFVGKLKGAKRRLTRFALKRKSSQFNKETIAHQFSWIGHINDEYAHDKKNKIASSRYHFYAYYIRVINNAIIVLTFISIVFSIVISELYISKSNEYLHAINPNEEKNKTFYYQGSFFSIEFFAKMDEREISPVENGFIYANIVLSVIVVVLLWVKSQFVIKKFLFEKKISMYDTIFSLGMFPKYFIESIIALISFPPHANVIFTGRAREIHYVYPLTAILLLLSYLKIYLIFENCNDFYKFSSEIAKSVYNNNHIKPGYHFYYKCLFKTQPLFFLFFSILFFVIIFASLVHTFELGTFYTDSTILGKKGINDMRTIINCLWLIAMTVLSVAFGDATPRSFFGRVVTFVSSVIGIAFLSYVVIYLSTFLEMRPKERKAFYKLKRLLDKDNDENKAADVVKSVLFMRRHRRVFKGSEYSLHSKVCVTFLLYTSVRLFKNKNYVSAAYAMPVNDLLNFIGKNMQDNWEEMNKNFMNISNIEDDLIAMVKTTKELDKKLMRIAAMQSRINNYLIKRMNEKCKERQNWISKSNKALINLSERGSRLTFRAKKMKRIKNKFHGLESIVSVKLKKRGSNMSKEKDDERKIKFKSGAIKQFVFQYKV